MIIDPYCHIIKDDISPDLLPPERIDISLVFSYT